MIVRYVDDTVLGFESKGDVDRFLEDLKARFAQFGLTLNEDKTRVLQFGRFAAQARAKLGLAKPPTYDFFGFTHICGKSRSNGWFQLKRLTSAKRMRARLKAIREALMRRMHEPIPVIGRWLRRVVQGYFNYHAVPGNVDRLDAFRKAVSRAWLHALRRRGVSVRRTHLESATRNRDDGVHQHNRWTPWNKPVEPVGAVTTKN